MDDLHDRVDELDVQYNRTKRQEEGWFGIYVECPNCKVPMARVTTEASSASLGPDSRITESKHVGLCPRCHERRVVLTVEKIDVPAH